MTIIQLAPKVEAETEKPCPLTPGRYLVLIRMRAVPEKRNGLLIPEDIRDQYLLAETVGQILQFGDDAFRDDKKFPRGRTYEVGQWVDIKRYTGERRNLRGIEYRYIADTDVLGPVADPDAVDPFTLKTRL